MSCGIIILAAGNGSRMQSSIPKVLHKLAGKPMLSHLVTTALKLSDVKQIVVVGGTNIKQLQAVVQQEEIIWAHQLEQMGTADAVVVGLSKLAKDLKKVIILSGDTPLISIDTLNKLIINTPQDAIGIITADVAVPTGYGRVVRDNYKNFLKIVEELDATNLEKQITEINVGVYLFPQNFLINFPVI